MCTIYTHGVVGLGAGTLFARSKMPASFWLLAALLPMLPDADSFWDAPYGTMLGHRGFTHSLLFALAVALAAGALLRHRLRYVPLVIFIFIIIGSHGILDAFTDGGFGIPLLWPFSNHRVGPWGPIHVSDIGLELPDWRTSRTVQTELLYVWLPVAIIVAVRTIIWAWQRGRTRTGATPGLPV
jgi:inner membrane protein